MTVTRLPWLSPASIVATATFSAVAARKVPAQANDARRTFVGA